LSDEEIRYDVRSTSTETVGRTLNSARGNHFVIDSPSGPAEALLTGEAFIAGIAACGVTLIQSIAKERNVAVGPITADVGVVRLKSAPADIHRLDARFEFRDTPRQLAEELVEGWKAR
jgi:organic hydroperoxide reductase OsmC/OhrA